jgi:hypothetical protein
VSVCAPVFNRFHARAFGLCVVPGPQYAVPAQEGYVGLCVSCGKEVTDCQDYIECDCWSEVARRELRGLVHDACLNEMKREW